MWGSFACGAYGCRSVVQYLTETLTLDLISNIVEHRWRWALLWNELTFGLNEDMSARYKGYAGTRHLAQLLFTLTPPVSPHLH